MQEIFDKVSPMRGAKPTETPPEPATPPQEPPPPPEPETPSTPAEPEVKTEEKRVPSFIEKALEVPPTEAESQTADKKEEDWPEELPTFKSSEESKKAWKNWREKYNALKTEAKQLKERPAVDPNINQELEFLRERTKAQEEILARTSVEHHQEFQQKIIAPMHGAWNEAARIVHEAGGDPQDLAKALSLSGRAQFEALDTIMEGMPESAKIEANEAIRAYKRFDNQRRQALAEAPKTAETLRKNDLQRQYETISKQKEEMKNLFENAVAKLRDEAKVEVLQKSDDPDAKWWNDQADQIVEQSRRLYLDNTDMGKVAIACALAPMADVYRKLWMAERQDNQKNQKIIKDRFGSEPNLSESGGASRSTTKDDLAKPFTDVFLQEFHKQREQGVTIMQKMGFGLGHGTNRKVSGKDSLKAACPPMGNVTVKPGCDRDEKMEKMKA